MSDRHLREPERDDTRALVMKAAKHLSASRMAWAISRISTGINWTGSTKGDMAEAVANGRLWGHRPRLLTAQEMTRVIDALMAQENTKGQKGSL